MRLSARKNQNLLGEIIVDDEIVNINSIDATGAFTINFLRS
jgi:hypothetical protein